MRLKKNEGKPRWRCRGVVSAVPPYRTSTPTRGGGGRADAPVLRPARTSRRVVLPAPLGPMRAVSVRGRAIPDTSHSSCFVIWPTGPAGGGGGSRGEGSREEGDV